MDAWSIEDVAPVTGHAGTVRAWSLGRAPEVPEIVPFGRLAPVGEVEAACGTDRAGR